VKVKILGVCGSLIKGGNTEVYLREALNAAEALDGVETEMITLAGREIRDCLGCAWCVAKQEEGKFCAQSDDMVEIYHKLLAADGLLLATPVYVGRLSGLLACFIDRMRALTGGNFYRGRLRNKPGGALAVSQFRNAGMETTLFSIIYAFMAYEMIPVAPRFGLGCHWGACGLSSETGTGRRDAEDKLMVLRDEQGMEMARSLARRVVRLAELLNAGARAMA
jgi:multimeric flavodoxin WrbA